MTLLSLRLQKAGFAVFIAEYPSRTATLDEAREGVAKQIDNAVGLEGRCALVGHSLGGVIAAQLKSGSHKGRIGRLVQMGSPNLGSPLADVARQVPGVADVMGPVLHTIAEADLPQLPLSDLERAEIGCIAGTGGWRMVTAAYGLEGENDGKVSVESAFGVPHGDDLLVDASHSTLTLSSDVADQTIHFLRHGVFDKSEA